MIGLRSIMARALLLAPAAGAAQVGKWIERQRVRILREYLDLLASENLRIGNLWGAIEAITAVMRMK